VFRTEAQDEAGAIELCVERMRVIVASA